MSSSHDPDHRRDQVARVFETTIADLTETLTRMGSAQRDALAALATAVAACWEQGGKLLICGNGGSAADAQHIAAELVGRFLAERSAYPAIALTTNTSILTSVGNDYGFDAIFARQVSGLGRIEDILLVISTSGNSPNCIEAVAAARRVGMRVFGFLGSDGGALRDLVDAALIVPSESTPRIQEVHITMGHLLCALLERWRTTGRLTGGAA